MPTVFTRFKSAKICVCACVYVISTDRLNFLLLILVFVFSRNLFDSILSVVFDDLQLYNVLQSFTFSILYPRGFLGGL